MEWFFIGLFAGIIGTIIFIGGAIGVFDFIINFFKKQFLRNNSSNNNHTWINRNDRSMDLYNRPVEELEILYMAQKLNVKIGE